MKKHFDILGLPEGSSQEAIQEAYDKLSIELSPAKNNNQEFFVEEYDKLQEAYKALSNSTILKSSEKSYINTNGDGARQEALPKPNNDSITITISPEKIEKFKNKTQGDIQNHKYKELSQVVIIAGFVFSIFGGWGGIALGAYCAFGSYEKDTKLIGWVMLILGTFNWGTHNSLYRLITLSYF